MGVDVFQRFFERIVDLCQEAGLVWGRELYFDATRVRADADTDSLVPRIYADAKAHVANVFGEQLEPRDESSVHPAADLLHLPVETRETDGAPQKQRVARWNLLEQRRLAPGRPSHRGYRRTSDFWVSTTDPDATPMWTAGKARLGYHDHYVVDGGKRRIIAEAKLWHGLCRFRRRGLENVNIEGLWVAAGQNLKRFLAATGWGRRHAPCGSLLALQRGSYRPSLLCG